MQNEKTIIISTSGTRYGPWLNQPIRLSDFYARLSVPVVGQEHRAAYLALPKREQDLRKDVGGFVGGELIGGQRNNHSVASRWLITLDLDKIPAGGTQDVLRRVDALGCGYAVYSTRKHAEHEPRLRVILPLHEAVSADEYEPLARLAAYYLDPTMQLFDRTTFEPARLMYWPSVCSDVRYVFTYADKPCLDGKALLTTFNWQDVSVWPRCPDEGEIIVRTAKKQADPATKEGVVGSFCRVYDIPAAMERFLPGVYDECGEGRYTLVGGSTVGGAVLYNDGQFLYSHHATDPCSGQLVNAFDLVRLHLFGKEDTAAKPGTPTVKLPSWTAMTKLCASDQQVRAQKISDRAEIIQRDFESVLMQQGLNAAASTQPSENVFELVQNKVEVNIGSVTVIAEMTEDCKKVTTRLVAETLKAAGLTVRRNEISGRVELSGDRGRYSKREALNTLLTDMSDWLKLYDVVAAPGSLLPYVHSVADLCRYNPVTDWLESAAAFGGWDGQDRVSQLSQILGVSEADYGVYIRKWFIQCVAMAYNDENNPKSADGVLVLQGPQGAGKTLFFRAMCPCHEWFVEGLTLDLKEKDSKINALSGWICELGELDSTFKREQSAIKAFITEAKTDIRAHYAFSSSLIIRRTSFCGTVNPEGFLKDETGSRRFWVVPVQNVNVQTLLWIKDTEGGKAWLSQLWQQVLWLWQQDKDGYRITAEQRAELERRNAAFDAEVPFQDELMGLFDWELPLERWGAWNTGELKMLSGVSASNDQIGRALAKIARKDQRIRQHRTMKSRNWIVPLERKNL